jgi:tRNA-splicing ligase RtcB
MSRGAAKRATTADRVRRELAAKGIAVECANASELAEEAPLAYKDIARVVRVVEQSGLAKVVARLLPLGVVKG